MKFLKKITSEEQIVEQNYNVLYCNETTNSVFIKKQVEPEVKITVNDSYTDTSIIGLTATKNIAVQGDIVWSTDLANGVVEIVNNTLRFLQHYEGTFKLTATADNASDEKELTVTCDEVATAYTYSVSNISSPTVEWDVTSATINFDGITIAHYAMKADESTSAPQSKVVTFEQNPPQGDNPMEFTANTEYVDLGLPSGLKWAKCNLGAQSETEDGAYFSWGDTKGYAKATDKGETSAQRNIEDKFTWNDVEVNYTVKQNGVNGQGFTWATDKWNGSSSDYDETYFASVSGTVCPNGVLAAENDAAHVHMGGNWRMPTSADTVELTANTTSVWTSKTASDGTTVYGREFTSKINGNKLFIPASGIFSNGSFYGEGSYGYYWSSPLYSSNPSRAYCLYFNSDNCDWRYSNRFCGYSVRGVLVSKN